MGHYYFWIFLKFYSSKMLLAILGYPCQLSYPVCAKQVFFFKNMRSLCFTTSWWTFIRFHKSEKHWTSPSEEKKQKFRQLTYIALLYLTICYFNKKKISNSFLRPHRWKKKPNWLCQIEHASTVDPYRKNKPCTHILLCSKVSLYLPSINVLF